MYACAHLAWCFDSFPQAEVDDSEDEEEAEHQLPADHTHFLQTLRLVQLQHVPPAHTEPALTHLQHLHLHSLLHHIFLCLDRELHLT